jgi:hypothetical protein
LDDGLEKQTIENQVYNQEKKNLVLKKINNLKRAEHAR